MSRKKTKARAIRHSKTYGFQLVEFDESYVFEQDKSKRFNMLKKQYIKLAKRADQRLVRLERLTKQQGFENIDKFAYASARRDISKRFGDNVSRFNRSVSGMSERELEYAISDVINFLNMVTSTKQGIVKSYNKRYETLKETLNDPNIKWADAIEVFERQIIDRYDKTLDSTQILKIVSKQQANKKAFDKWVSKQTGKSFKTARDKEDLIKFVSNKVKSGEITQEALNNYLAGD